MIIGETICAVSEQTTVVYSPWFQRQGNAATFVLDVIDASTPTGGSADPTVTVTVQTKNSEDVDPGSPATGGTFAQTGAGRQEHRNSNFKELVRFKFEVSTSASGIAWSHFRMLNPAWETN